LALNPKSPDLLNYLGNIKMRRGDMAAALDYYARARAHIGPDQGEKYEMQLLSVLYTNGISGQLAGDMHKAWGDALIARQMNHRRKYSGLEPRKILKIGYVSADFYESSPAYFLMPLLENHDRTKVEIYLYSSLSRPDLYTQRFKQLGAWRDIETLSDSEAIDLIREDDIDILVDLLGQTQGARHAIFARKAAPVQVTWLGYAATTGLSTIDYRFTDPIADPPGMTESYHAEELYRLSHFLCYQPPPHTPPVTELPALESGVITFGCFNQSMKITDEVVETWATIMERVENSRLIVKAAEFGDPQTLLAFQEKFVAHGISRDRLLYYNRTNFKFDHLNIYSEIDIALDPFPFNGTTTTFETLWMGVPMVTLEGNVHAARVGCAILTPLGLTELIGSSIEDYIAKAVALAHDLPRLQRYRAGMRPLLAGSPMMDGTGFARSVEKAYFDMWARAVAG
jgi:predicted O-linked N-acetylglucosamine transferase (SPINDLY family)